MQLMGCEYMHAHVDRDHELWSYAIWHMRNEGSSHAQYNQFSNTSRDRHIPQDVEKEIDAFVLTHESAHHYVVHAVQNAEGTTWMVGYVIPTTHSVCYLRGCKLLPSGHVQMIAYWQEESTNKSCAIVPYAL